MKSKRRKWSAWGFLALGIGLLVLGLLTGEYSSVLEKAVTVCLDCIGIG